VAHILFYITGLAAPAIAAGFGALAPTLGTLMPVIGASGFAAMATAAGSVAGSVAVAASFGGRPKCHVHTLCGDVILSYDLTHQVSLVHERENGSMIIVKCSP
jgi:hypothetical protein